MKKDKVTARPVPSIHERRAVRAVEGEKAMAEYLAAEEQTRRNTERLRQLRLSKVNKEPGLRGRAGFLLGHS